MPVVRRTRPVSLSRESQMTGLMARRLAPAPKAPADNRARKPVASEAKTTPMQGGVVRFREEDTSVLIDILKRSRRVGRPPRIGGYLHVSDLLSRCLRAKALLRDLGTPPAMQQLTLMDTLTFAQGDAIHDTIKEHATMGAPGSVWGKWKCKCGTLRIEEPCTYDEVDKNLLCSNCGRGATQYEENPIENDQYEIVGTPDLVLWMRAMSAYYITELKSISHLQFGELVRPKPEHVLQILFYWFLMKEAGYPLVGQVSILYVTKGYVMGFHGDPYKEFVFDPEPQLRRLTPYLEDALVYKANKVPERTNCSSPSYKDAKECPVCDTCFNGPRPKNVSVPLSSVLGRKTNSAGR